ncbi:MAG: hypothetical protein JST26_00495 [Bacteroidetes bacterium]|nr:hypothetical protein [Bacteroidota bacterium]
MTLLKYKSITKKTINGNVNSAVEINFCEKKLMWVIQIVNVLLQKT